ncbi:hypothetical protein BJX70DRAFT_108360 [Aspergillus crustosus]
MREAWVRNGYDRWIREEGPPGRNNGSSEKLESPQNGLLLGLQLQVEYEMLVFTIDPDDEYRVVDFNYDDNHVADYRLSCRATTRGGRARVSDDCLRWHFHQTVLTWVRGPAEPIWSQDVSFENIPACGKFEEKDLVKERDSVKRILEWESENIHVRIQ